MVISSVQHIQVGIITKIFFTVAPEIYNTLELNVLHMGQNLFTTSSVFYISLPVTYCCWMKWYTSYHGVHRKPPAPLDIRVQLRARTGRSPTPAWGLCSVWEPAAGPRGGPPWPPPRSRPATDGGGVSADRCPFRWPWRWEPRPGKPGSSWGPCCPAAGGRTLVQTRQQRQTHTDGELLGTMRANQLLTGYSGCYTSWLGITFFCNAI